MSEALLKVVLLHHHYENNADAIIDHLRAIQTYSRHHVDLVAINSDDILSLDFGAYDCLILHYSMVAAHDSFLSPGLRARIRSFRGPKAAFVQDEYRFVFRTIDVLHYLGAEALFTVVPEDQVNSVYPVSLLPTTQKITLLTGYVPEQLTRVSVPPLADRTIDIGYRARKLPAWLGHLGQKKWQIGESFERYADNYGLAVDISSKEKDRLYGRDWIEFLSNCRAVLGTESEISVFDFTGEIEQNCSHFEARYPDVSFEEVSKRFFQDEDGALTISVISPRCFEAAALRTLMVLHPGDYSKRLSPWHHYVPLSEDFSNIDEVVAVLRDEVWAQEIVDRAYCEVALAPENSYRAMVRKVDRWIGRRSGKVAGKIRAEAPISTRPAPPASQPTVFPATLRAFARLLPAPTRRVLRGAVIKLLPFLRLALPVKHHWLYFALRLRIGHLRTPLASAIELAILLNELGRCRPDGNTPTRLFWDPKRGSLVIRKMQVDRLDTWGSCSISSDELVEILAQRKVRTLAWDNWDWGNDLPRGLGRHHIFPSLTGSGLPAPRQLARLIWQATHRGV